MSIETICYLLAAVMTAGISARLLAVGREGIVHAAVANLRAEREADELRKAREAALVMAQSDVRVVD